MLPWVPDVQRFCAEHQLVVPLVYLPNVSGVIRHTEIGERREFSATCPFIQQHGRCVLTLWMRFLFLHQRAYSLAECTDW